MENWYQDFQKKYYYEAKVLLKCHQGFSLKGSNTIVCGADSTWKPEMPECIKEPTPPSTNPPTPPGTKPSTSSHSVPTLSSTKSPISTDSGVEPTTFIPAVTPGPSTPSDKPSSKDLGPGGIAGIVIASLAGILLLGGGVYVICKRKKKGLQEN